MRGFVKSFGAISLTTLAICCLNLEAQAQQSTDSIINALKPSGNLVTGSTRGIRLGGTPSAPAPSAGRPVSTPSSATSRPVTNTQGSAPAPVAGPSVNLTVNFPTGSAELTPSARAALDALGRALASSELASFRLRIEGHTDNVGSKEENRALSQRRAETVVSYLTSQYNVGPARLEAVGMGQDSPLIETPPQTPQARNRRVQVINLGA